MSWTCSGIILINVLILAIASEEVCNPKACSKDVDNEKAVCGSDGLTYPNRCLFEKARCLDRNLTLSKRGPCRHHRLCRDWEVYRHTNPQYRYKANCRPDGSYTAAQCHPDTGACWCVTPEGVPLPYTSVRWKRDSKPHCGRKKKSTRSSSASSSAAATGGRNNSKARNRACKQPDKAKFNNNLINIFYTEWSREHKSTRQQPHTNETDFAVNQWKFGTLDLNADGFLDRNEYRDLKKVAKKAVKPKRCAKNFPRSCDLNGDTKISQQEWAECLTRDGMDDVGPPAPSPNGGGLVETQSGEVAGNDEDDYVDSYNVPTSNAKPSPHAVDSVLSLSIGQNYDDESSEIRDDEATDCISDRQTALLDGGQFYVPECTSDGRYEKIQCYKAAGYCFCVHEDTGKNIPGTSVKNGTPKCDHLSNMNRPMKGCPDNKKDVFLRDLLNFLHTRMSEIINNSKSLGDLPWISSREEQAATWSFVVFDKNKNKLLDRNEWKSFKEIVSDVKSLKKCGKKLPRYCDINKDRHISMTEWLDCLNVQQASMNNTSISSRAGKKNPLSMLMED